jgi:phage gpG-like protein
LRKAEKQTHVAVGILQDEQRPEGFSMVDLAAVHEYGSNDLRIPARSFIRSTCDAKGKEHLELIRKLQWKIIGRHITAKQALVQLGEVVSKDMVQTINAGIEPELKEVTIKRKKSSRPLIDTGRLKAAITHEVRGSI